jgi:tetratricopeptide repeat protein 21B
LLLAAQAQWLTGAPEAAHATLERSFRAAGATPGSPAPPTTTASLPPFFLEALNATAGWIEVTTGQAMPGTGKPITPSTALAVGPISRRETETANTSALRYLETAAAALTTAVASASGSGSSSTSAPLYIDCMMGLAYCYERRGDYQKAVDTLAEVTARFPAFAPAQTEKAKILLRGGDYDGAAECINGLLEADASALDALRLAALHTALLEGPGLRLVQRLQDIKGALTTSEPRNARLHYDLARCFGRLCGRSRPALAVTLTLLLDGAVKNEPDTPATPAYWCEVGTQRLLSGDPRGAAAAFREAASLDESDLNAAAGAVSCLIAQGHLEDAETQLSMLNMLAASATSASGSSSSAAGGGANMQHRLVQAQIAQELSLLEAQVAWRSGRNRQKQLACLGRAAETRLSSAGLMELRVPGKLLQASSLPRTTPEGVRLPPPDCDVLEWYYRLSPEALLEIGREYLQQQTEAQAETTGAAAGAPNAGSSNTGTGSSGAGTGSLLSQLASGFPHADATDVGSEACQKGFLLIDAATSCVPACMSAWLLASVAHTAAESWSGAGKALARALELDPSFVDAHLLLAHISLQQGDAKAANAALDNALVQSFAVQDSVIYLRLRGAVLSALGKHSEAIGMLESSLKHLLPPQQQALLQQQLQSHQQSSQGGGLTGISVGGARSKGIDSSAGSVGRFPLTGIATYVPPPSAMGPNSSASAAAATAAGGVSLYDRASICIHLAEAYMNATRTADATRLIDEARKEFAGTAEEVRVLIAAAKLAVRRGDPEPAIDMLSSVPVKSPAYPQALAVKAGIFLTHRRDRRLYLQCFQEAAQRQKNERGYVALGEACLRVQMPEDAVAAFEKALQLRPSNTQLACKIGRALTSMHEYEKAVQYYQNALNQIVLPAQDAASSSTAAAAATAADRLGALQLRSELADLLLRIRRFEEARTLIDEALQDVTAHTEDFDTEASEATAKTDSDVATLKLARRNLQLLSKVSRSASDLEGSVEALRRSLVVQNTLVTLARRAADNGIAASFDLVGAAAAGLTLRSTAEESADAAAICMAMGEVCEKDANPPDEEKALEYYQLALQYVDAYAPALLSLARLALHAGDLDQCRALCSQVLEADSGNEEGNLMLADLLFRQNDAVDATKHFLQLIESRPDNYEALYRLLLLLKRAGRLDEAGKYLKVPLRKKPTAENDLGYKFCKGALHYFNNEPAEAIKLLNAARQAHTEWYGPLAVEYMVGIYLSPEKDPLWIDREEENDTERDEEEKEAHRVQILGSLRVAARLLDDIPFTSRKLLPRWDALRCYVLIASRDKLQVEEAISRLTGLLGRNESSPSLLLALATAFMVSQQPQKARNEVKKLLKLPFDTSITEEFVNAWLLLADIFIDSGKFDQAKDSLQRALELDASAGRAYEYLGAIADREQRYAEAAEMYERAWGCDNESSAAVGHKLALNYLKAGNGVASISVCQKLRQQFPDVPKLWKDILDKARTNIRV